jgi:glycerol transport system ATP-binding protein
VQLQLENLSKTVGRQTHIYPMDVTLAPGVNVFLGTTLAGKTSLMRLIAGLDQPSTGRVLVGGRDVTGVPVRERRLAMVYQQFINYPSLTVYDNIASPLKLRRLPRAEVDARVRRVAEKLRIDHLLERLPAELSGGQQQRTALARALVKESDLILLDEPLVNLDYKLREELRAELSSLFADGRAIVIYATTEPTEALLMGGHVAVLDAGCLIQYGPVVEVYRQPASTRVAAAFNDPPMNLFDALVQERGACLVDGTVVPLTGVALTPGQQIRLGVRAHQIGVAKSVPGAAAVHIGLTVDLAEISGSATYLHASREGLSLVAELPGVHAFTLGAPVAAEFDPADVFVFDANGKLLRASADARARKAPGGNNGTH